MSLVDLLPSDARLTAVPAGELIFAQGDRGDKMYVIAEGEVRILIDGKLVEVIGAGAILGEMALLDSEPRSATAITKTRCVLVPLDERSFTDLVMRRPEFALQVMRVLAHRLRRAGLER